LQRTERELRTIMSEVLTGNAANITTPLTVAVTAMANNGSGAIRVTTSPAHLFGSNDLVLVDAGSVDAFFTITVIDSTHFDCVGSTFVSGGSGATTDYSLTPQIQFPTDGDTFSAQLSGLLSSGQALCDRTQFLARQFALLQLAFNNGLLGRVPSSFNFCQVSAPAGGVTLYTGPGWDPISRKWMIGGNTLAGGTGDISIVVGRNEPTAWEPLLSSSSVSPYSGTPLQVCRGIEPGVSPANKYVYLADLTSGGDAVVIRADTNANAWAASFPAGVISDATDISILSVSGVVVAAVGAGSTDSNVYYSTNSGGSWTAQTAASIANPIPIWLLAQSVIGGGQILAIPGVASLGPGYLSSSNGTTWVSQAALPYASGQTETATGLVYTTNDYGVPMWLLVTYTTISEVVYTYNSFDGVNWTHFVNDLPSIRPLVQLQAVGGVVVAMVDEGSPSRVVVSYNGGRNWVDGGIEINQGGSFDTAASPNGVMIVTGSGYVPSLVYGSPGGVGFK
jgi:hypothetical protein